MCLPAFLVLVATSHASFEMMLLPGADGRIYRYDPVNNVNLGSYRGAAGVTMVAANLGGKAYGTHYTNAIAYGHEYSTGIAIGSASTGIFNSTASELVGDTLFVMGTGEVRKFNTLTGAQVAAVSLASGVSFRTMTRYANRLIFMGLNGSNQLTYQTMDMDAMVGSATVTSTATVLAGSTIGKATALRNSTSNTTLALFTYQESATVMRMGRFSLNLDGTIVSGATSAQAINSFSGTNLMPALMAGHNTVYIYGQDATVATDARLTSYDLHISLTPSLNSTFAAGGGFRSGLHGYQGAILVAPEPGTMIGLGLGLAAILKRRRSRA